MSKRTRVVMRAVALGAIALAVSCSSAAQAASPTPPPQPVAIDKNSALILIRTTLVALHQANQTGNYSVLYGISAPGFQSANTPDRLAQIFANLRAKNFDLSGVVVLEPQLTVLPELYSNGVMRMAGFFPSVPMQVYFDLQFKAVEGQWRLLAVSVDVGSATPAAPRLTGSQVPTTPKQPSTESSRPTGGATIEVAPSAVTPRAIEVRPALTATATPRP